MPLTFLSSHVIFIFDGDSDDRHSLVTRVRTSESPTTHPLEFGRDEILRESAKTSFTAFLYSDMCDFGGKSSSSPRSIRNE